MSRADPRSGSLVIGRFSSSKEQRRSRSFSSIDTSAYNHAPIQDAINDVNFLFFHLGWWNKQSSSRGLRWVCKIRFWLYVASFIEFDGSISSLYATNVFFIDQRLNLTKFTVNVELKFWFGLLLNLYVRLLARILIRRIFFSKKLNTGFLHTLKK